MGFMWKNEIKAQGTKRLNGVEYIALEVSDKDGIADENDLIDDDINKHKLSQLRMGAVVVSWISVIFAFITGVAAIVMGQTLESEALFGYGLDAVLDSLSSIAVIWRFNGNAASLVAEARERKACIIISLFFFISAFSLIFKSSTSLGKGSRDEEDGRLFTDIFSTVCGSVALVLATLKVYLGKRLDSRSLLTDSIITYVGAAMSFLGVLGLELYRANDQIWYLDALFGLLCGIFLMLFGGKLIVQMTCLYGKVDPLHEDGCDKNP